MKHPDLLELLRGDLSNQAAAEAGEHLDECADCRLELAELAIVHTVLNRSVRTLGTHPAGAKVAAPLPPLRRDRRRRRRLVGIAAAMTVVGLVGTVAALATDDGPSPSLRARVSTPFDPVGGQGGGRVVMVASARQTTKLTVTTRDLPSVETGQFYEVWLLDPEALKLLALGPLGPSGRAAFEVDDTMLDRYSAIDVSLEDDDGDAGHSADSVLRASYDVDPPSRS